MKLPIVPICKNQLLDVKQQDLIENGLYRKCNIYKGGGGYDKFPAICKQIYNIETDYQFIVQTKGCPFECPYCYVTKQGVNGEAFYLSVEEIVKAFEKSNLNVLHLMGGAPALYIESFKEFILPENKVFHSDLLLVEKEYKQEHFELQSKAIFAVSIKGQTQDEYLENTGKQVDIFFMLQNLNVLIKSGVNFYFTFTGCEIEGSLTNLIISFFGKEIFKNSFKINIVNYEATKGINNG